MRFKQKVNAISVVSTDFLKYYNKEKLKHPKIYRINSNKDKVDSVIREICRQVKINLIESEGGVIMKDWGYFFVNRSYGKMYHYIKEEGEVVGIEMNRKTNSFVYNPIFLPRIEGVKNFWGWSFDYTFTNDIIKSIYMKLEQGVRYKAFPWTIIRLKLI